MSNMFKAQLPGVSQNVPNFYQQALSCNFLQVPIISMHV